ncbi:MAG TPA: YibE/F family protein [Patescibacteria group bacterium]|nr:YibE/F family protein [Patescibacteria group bacterium]
MKQFLISIFLLLSFPSIVFAQGKINTPKDEYYKAKVVNVNSEGEVISNGKTNLYQNLKLQIEDGPNSGKSIDLHYGDPVTLTKDHELQKGDQIVLLKTTNPDGKVIYSVYDKYRFNKVIVAIVLFFILVILIAGLKGVGSLVGLVTSLAVILMFIVPNILQGRDPLFISIVGSLIILFVSTYVAHGVSKQTTVALVSTFFALFITAILATIATSATYLTGIGNEDIASLQIGATSIINLKGLFLGGIIIGTLGALNDVTITQAATIFEIAHVDKDIRYSSLVKRGFNVGKEHILSLVNTLVLAYAGSSLFIFIFIVLNPGNIPYWVILNTEMISGETISTIVGSAGLIMAVPISTLLAAWIVLNWKNKVAIKGNLTRKA